MSATAASQGSARPRRLKLETLEKFGTLVGPGQRGRWTAVVVLAVTLSLVEATGTLLIFALLGLLAGGGDAVTLPVVGDLRDLLPQMSTDDLVIGMGVVVCAFFIVRSVMIILQEYVEVRVAENTGARLSTRMLDGYLAMPYLWHLQHNSSELIRNAFDSVQRFVREGLIPAVRILSSSAIVVGVAVVLWVTSPLATALALLVLGPSLWVVLRVVHPRVERLGHVAQRMARRNLQALQQCLQGIPDIMLLGREATFVDSYRRDRRKLARARYLQRTASQVPRVTLETGIVLFIVVFLGAVVMTGGVLADVIPVLGLFGYAAIRLMPELTTITSNANALKFVGPAVDDIYDDLIAMAEAGASASRADSSQPLVLTRSLTIDDVSFSYPGDTRYALTGVDIEIHAGESIGVVGPTGGGKSTLIALILGLLEPRTGSVRVDGVDIRTRLRDWHATLGVVPQMVFLTDDTLRRNIALGVPDAEIDEDAVHAAVRDAQLSHFVDELPHGLDTYVGERGVRVSGGQRQRLAIARALYRRPDVLLFDEGTSALDGATEAALMAALEALRGERTIITVAHRLTTVASCDRVILVRDGRITDVGPYADLAERHASLRLTAS